MREIASSKLKEIFRISGKRTAIVTGGASGIGAACVRRFLKYEISVVALDLNENLLNKMQRDLNNPNLYIVAGNVCYESARGKAIDLVVNKSGSLGILVNNAAIFLLSGIDATREQWQKTFEVNLLAGANLVTQSLSALRKSEHPAIVNIASISAHCAQTGRWTYNAMKGALLELTKCQALDLAPGRIRVNSISPGWIWTETLDEAAQGDRKKWEPIWGCYSMINRCGEPDELAAAVAWLASPDAMMFNTNVVFELITSAFDQTKSASNINELLMGFLFELIFSSSLGILLMS